MEDYELMFESDKIYYVKVTEKLLDDYLIMINDPEVQKFISKTLKVYTKEGELGWIKTKLEEEAPIFSMVDKETKKFIGNIEIMDIKDGYGELGISLTRTMQDKHYGQEALRTIIDYAFNTLKLNELGLNVYDFNARAIHCYEKVGFIKDGVGKEPEDIHMTYRK